MKVKDLIKHLQAMPQDLEVVYHDDFALGAAFQPCPIPRVLTNAEPDKCGGYNYGYDNNCVEVVRIN